MQYWLHVGMVIFGVGLVKPVAYQSWSTMRQRGNTIDILDLNIRALKGSASDAANLLLLRRRNRSLGVFVLIHAAIIAAISLVVGKTITTVTDTGSVELLFDYPMNISILNAHPISQFYSFNPPDLGGTMYDATRNWFTNGATNSTFNETFSGTFIIQDSRAEYGQPSGQQIGGSVSCFEPLTISMIEPSALFINITFFSSDIRRDQTIPVELDPLAFATGNLIGQHFPTLGSMNTSFIWFSITNGIIPNAMEVNGCFDGTLYIGLCEHTITFSNLSQNDASGDGMQYINPVSPPYTFLLVKMNGLPRRILTLPRTIQ